MPFLLFSMLFLVLFSLLKLLLSLLLILSFPPSSSFLTALFSKFVLKSEGIEKGNFKDGKEEEEEKEKEEDESGGKENGGGNDTDEDMGKKVSSLNSLLGVFKIKLFVASSFSSRELSSVVNDCDDDFICADEEDEDDDEDEEEEDGGGGGDCNCEVIVGGNEECVDCGGVVGVCNCEVIVDGNGCEFEETVVGNGCRCADIGMKFGESKVNSGLCALKFESVPIFEFWPCFILDNKWVWNSFMRLDVNAYGIPLIARDDVDGSVVTFVITDGENFAFADSIEGFDEDISDDESTDGNAARGSGDNPSIDCVDVDDDEDDEDDADSGDGDTTEAP